MVQEFCPRNCKNQMKMIASLANRVTVKQVNYKTKLIDQNLVLCLNQLVTYYLKTNMLLVRFHSLDHKSGNNLM